MSCTKRLIALAGTQLRPVPTDYFSLPTWEDGSARPTPDMRGAWIGFSWSHTQAPLRPRHPGEHRLRVRLLPAHFARDGPELALHRNAGDGRRRPQRVWNQIKADVLGVPYQRLQRPEFGTWGSAMIAGKAVGIYDDLVEVAAAVCPAGRRAAPTGSCTPRFYQPLVKKHIALQQVLRGTFAESRTSAPDQMKEN